MPDDFDYASLEVDLAELEREVPAVGAAADQYEATKRDIIAQSRGGKPWPDVQECYGGHRTKSGIALYGNVEDCPQCDGRLNHQWVEWKEAPADYGVPVRCRICGARKCDLPDCQLRRHHAGPHLDWSVPAKEW